MIKLNNLAKAIGTAALLIGANAALAETVTVPASVTVNNAIDFTFTGELNFGEIRAIASELVNECAVIGLPANPANPLAGVATSTLCSGGAGTAPNNAVIQSVGGTPSRPEFTIAGVAPFTTMNLTLPAGEIPLAAALAPGAATFTVGNFTAYRTSGTPGTVTTTIQTTAAGNATFTVGAELATHVDDSATTWTYENGIPYQGTFEVTVAY